MLPIAALSENQTWCAGDFTVYVRCEGDAITPWLATVGRDGDLPANPAEDEWFDAGTQGLEGVKREWGPNWAMPPDAWRTVVERLGLRLVHRRMRYETSSPELTALLAAQLQGSWSTTAYWTFSHTDAVMIGIDHEGRLAITGGDPHLDALREHTGLPLEAPTPLHRRLLEVPRDDALGVFVRVVSWSPQTFSWVQASV